MENDYSDEDEPDDAWYEPEEELPVPEIKSEDEDEMDDWFFDEW